MALGHHAPAFDDMLLLECQVVPALGIIAPEKIEEALRPFEDIRPSAHARKRHARRVHGIARCNAGMKRFGARAELPFRAAGEARREAHRRG